MRCAITARPLKLYQIPHRVQQIMSNESTPILAGSIPAFEMFMTSWEMLAERNPRLQRWIEIGLSWARKYYMRMDDTHAYVVSMCKDHIFSIERIILTCVHLLVLNPAVRMTWIRKHWDPEYVRKAEDMIKATVSAARKQYIDMNDPI